MYHYTDSGLDNVYLVNGYEEIEIDGETCVSIHKLDALHEVIGKEISGKSNPLISKEFRFLRNELGLSQSAMGRLFDVDAQTIARWEKGESAIPRSNDILVRAMYLERFSDESTVHELISVLSEANEKKELINIQLEEIENNWKTKECAA